MRANLVNVSADDGFVMAYRLPIPRTPGDLELITYDGDGANSTGFELLTFPRALSSSMPVTGEAAPAMTAEEARPSSGGGEGAGSRLTSDRSW